MFKLLSKRGVIKQKTLTTGLPIYLKIDTFEHEAIWYFNHDDIEENDEVILMGHMGTDEYNDPQFFVNAYYNVSKNKISSTKLQIILWLGGSIIAMILTAIFNNSIPLFLLFLLELMIALLSLHSLRAYWFLDKEIKKLDKDTPQ